MRGFLSFRSVGIRIAAMAAFAAGMPAWAAGKLSPMDYIEIQQLVNQLNFALDYCGNGGRDFADLFTDDGEYVIDEGGRLRAIRGREQLAGLAGGPDCAVTRTAPRIHLSHVTANLVIEATSTGAHGRSYALYPGRNGKQFQEGVSGQVGVYHDDFVRTKKGWRIKVRRHEMAPEGRPAN